jgi:hypothetical protein
MAEGSSAHTRLDWFVIALLVVMVAMLLAALTGAYRVFGYALVTFLGMFTGLGFVRRGDRRTWGPPIAATSVLLIAFTGMFLNEGMLVSDPSDTLLGFQPGTAFLIYGVWIPALFTMGLGMTLIFDRLARHDEASAGALGAPPPS